ncbi:MAG: cbb3-type cytochrome c oxidase subunit I, partial [Truepera sp.]|nr:cbb3-type cytochrome c oxidase subunit I [Truepera sp.]
MAVTVGKAVTAEAGSPKRVSLLFILTGLFSLAGGVFLGPLQALNYAGIDLFHLPLPFLQSYYQAVSIHGVLMAIVFPSFFISGFLLYLPARELR